MKFVFNLAARVLRRQSLRAVVALSTLAIAAPSRAQAPYDTLPPYKIANNKEITNWNDLFTSFMRDESKPIGEMLEGGPVNNTVFDKYFNDIIFPMFTYEKNFNHPSMPTAKMRQRFKTFYVARAKNPAAKERLYELTLTKMDQIASGNFDPRARANAVFMVEELNDSEPGPPLKKAFPYLLKWVTDPKQIDAVRIPALRGVERHALAGIDPAQQQQVVKAMLEIVMQHTATPQQSLEGHEWILRRAVDILAAIGEPGDKGAVFNELVKLVEDESAPRPARAAAAEALAKIRFTPPKEYDAEGLVKSLTKLAVETYKAELAEAASKRRPIVVDRLKQQVGEVQKGLVGGDGKTGVALFLTAEPQKKFVADIVTNIDKLSKACDTPPANPPDPNNPLVAQTILPGVPFDTQEPIAKAISQAGGGLEAVLQAGVGGNANPAGLPGEVPPPGPAAARPAPVSAPAGAAGLPGG